MRNTIPPDRGVQQQVPSRSSGRANRCHRAPTLIRPRIIHHILQERRQGGFDRFTRARSVSRSLRCRYHRYLVESAGDRSSSSPTPPGAPRRQNPAVYCEAVWRQGPGSLHGYRFDHHFLSLLQLGRLTIRPRNSRNSLRASRHMSCQASHRSPRAQVTCGCSSGILLNATPARRVGVEVTRARLVPTVTALENDFESMSFAAIRMLRPSGLGHVLPHHCTARRSNPPQTERLAPCHCGTERLPAFLRMDNGTLVLLESLQ